MAVDDPIENLRRLVASAPPPIRRILIAGLEALRPPPSERPPTLH